MAPVARPPGFCLQDHKRHKMDDESLRVKAVLVVHRHGDRSPGINLFVSSPLERVEHQFWSDRVPHRDAPSVPASRFPAPHASKIGEAFDDDNYPFSLLSQAGQSQLFALGQRLRARYGQLIRAPDDVHVRSTNYRRTIDSARFALKGLVGDALSVPIHVGGEGDPLNPWKYNPGIAQGARMMRKSPTVVKAEAAAQATKEALVKRFPLYQARPELFSWVAVADYFVTRECYDSALVLDGVEACREAALDMMALQFLSFYKDVALRGMVVGPLVHGVHAWLAAKAGAPALKTDGAHPLLFDPAASVVVVSGQCVQNAARLRQWTDAARVTATKRCCRSCARCKFSAEIRTAPHGRCTRARWRLSSLSARPTARRTCASCLTTARVRRRCSCPPACHMIRPRRAAR